MRSPRRLRSLDDGVGAVLLVGTGPNFCTGGDVRGFAVANDPGRHVREVADEFHGFQRAVLAAPVPVVAAVHGWAAGAGMSVALAADIAVVGTSTRLRPAYPALGFSPDGGMSWLLLQLAGLARARHILLTDEVIDAQQALDWGLVATVVADGEVLSAAEGLAQRLANGPTRALGQMKQLLGAAADRSLDAMLDAEAAAIAASANGAEGREGVSAFSELRAPQFHAPSADETY